MGTPVGVNCYKMPSACWRVSDTGEIAVRPEECLNPFSGTHDSSLRGAQSPDSSPALYGLESSLWGMRRAPECSAWVCWAVETKPCFPRVVAGGFIPWDLLSESSSRLIPFMNVVTNSILHQPSGCFQREYAYLVLFTSWFFHRRNTNTLVAKLPWLFSFL